MWCDHLNTRLPHEKLFPGGQVIFIEVNYLKYKGISANSQNVSLTHANIDILSFYSNSSRNVK